MDHTVLEIFVLVKQEVGNSRFGLGKLDIFVVPRLIGHQKVSLYPLEKQTVHYGMKPGWFESVSATVVKYWPIVQRLPLTAAKDSILSIRRRFLTDQRTLAEIY